jgi:hypothetical protein
MNGLKMMAIALIATGILGLAYSSTSNTKGMHDAKQVSTQSASKDEGTASIPTWAGVGAIVSGLLLTMRKKKPALAIDPTRIWTPDALASSRRRNMLRQR